MTTSTKGGKRPGTGGKRAGSGRPPKNPDEKKKLVQLMMPPDVELFLSQMDGAEKNKAIENLIRKYMMPEKLRV